MKKRFNSSFHIYSEIEEVLRAGVSETVSDSAFLPSADCGREGNFAGTVVIFASVPYDDIGGGQRSAQLTRCYLQRMYRVIYIYRYPKVENGVETAAEYSSEQFSHCCFKNIDREHIFDDVDKDASVIFEFPHPDFLELLVSANARGLNTIYELIDPWDESLGDGWYTPELGKKFAELAGKVFATAKVLQKKLFEMGRTDAVYNPNAADFRYFNAMKDHPFPSDLPRNYRKKLLYFGSVYGNWFDWGTLKTAAARNKSNAFIIIGDPPQDRRGLPDNIIFMGMKKNTELAAYLAACDAAIIPFKPSKLVDAVSPVKVFEYLFMGRPVITRKMPELDGYPGVYQAADEDKFADLCSLEKVSVPSKQEIDLFISRNNWNYRLDVLEQRNTLKHTYSIIILIHNNESVIGRCLSTLLFHTQGMPVEVIVVDNASDDNGPALVEQKFKDKVKLIRNPRNGCSSGRNLGAAAAVNEILIFFDSDQWFSSKAWLTDYDFLIDSTPDTGAFSWNAGWFDQENLQGRIVDYIPNRAAYGSEYQQKGYRTDIHYLATSGFFIRKELFDRIGGFDEIFDPTVFEDTDLSLNVCSAGYNLAYRDFAGIMHQPHQTTKADNNNTAYNALWTRNLASLKAKWQSRLDVLLEKQQ